MKKKQMKPRLSLEKKVVVRLDQKQTQAVAGGVNSLEWRTRCCCNQAR